MKYAAEPLNPLLSTINAAKAAGAHTTLFNRSNAQILVRQPAAGMPRIMAPSLPHETPQVSHRLRAAAIAKALDSARISPPALGASVTQNMQASFHPAGAQPVSHQDHAAMHPVSHHDHAAMHPVSNYVHVSQHAASSPLEQPSYHSAYPTAAYQAMPAPPAVSGYYETAPLETTAMETTAPLEPPLSTPADWHIPNVQMTVRNQKVTLHDALFNRRGILFGVPGAFTPVCSQRHVPGFRDAMPILRQAVEYVACVAVNDPFVLKAWAKELGIPKDIVMISDWEGKFTEALGLELDASSYHMGVRCRRFCILVAQGTIVWFGLENDAFVDQVALILHRLQLLNDEQLHAIQDLANRLENNKHEDVGGVKETDHMEGGDSQVEEEERLSEETDNEQLTEEVLGDSEDVSDDDGEAEDEEDEDDSEEEAEEENESLQRDRRLMRESSESESSAVIKSGDSKKEPLVYSSSSFPKNVYG
eukprot:Gregarina_sp_Pseudo_9__749@NODE_1480_length_1560_cov_22_907955_g1370_i0_p1_GENE_NODE_1480_length_1560_cov_22_907955_g1370_i0NODE_1480_length_1560_cov_22_907955_g1370_i0_p1_ORF_typecomplete_len476_score133_15Redoxin/PF08534_10/3_1e20AhpCTSA/PF00578_21/1_4e07YL1/PF05764_13/2_9Merozoite_SPAM/PF07133_11/3_7_NODE_1480_length_1560_cov_22_907955_g1370_i01261553